MVKVSLKAPTSEKDVSQWLTRGPLTSLCLRTNGSLLKHVCASCPHLSGDITSALSVNELISSKRQQDKQSGKKKKIWNKHRGTALHMTTREA